MYNNYDYNMESDLLGYIFKTTNKIWKVDTF